MSYKAEVFNKYADHVAEAHSITKDKLFSNSKERPMVDARHMLYYLCKTRPMRIRFIQDFMGEQGYPINHSSIIHGINYVEKNKLQDRDFVAICNRIEGCVTL